MFIRTNLTKNQIIINFQRKNRKTKFQKKNAVLNRTTTFVQNFKKKSMTFQELNINRPLLNALEDIGLSEPTPIQEQSFSTIMSGKDFVGLAQTGNRKNFCISASFAPTIDFLKKNVSAHFNCCSNKRACCASC